MRPLLPNRSRSLVFWINYIYYIATCHRRRSSSIISLGLPLQLLALIFFPCRLSLTPLFSLCDRERWCVSFLYKKINKDPCLAIKVYKANIQNFYRQIGTRWIMAQYHTDRHYCARTSFLAPLLGYIDNRSSDQFFFFFFGFKFALPSVLASCYWNSIVQIHLDAECNSLSLGRR